MTIPNKNKSKNISKGSTAAKTSATEVARRARKVRRTVAHGNVHVLATYNNTIVTVTDKNGATLGWASSGAIGFKGAKKSTPYAAGQVVHNLMDRLESVGLREVDVFVKGIGSGREAAVRAFQARGVNVATIKDVTPIPHNGVRPKKQRRV
ncbi:MAG: 30S ribosomal protein S11 [Parcubacteria group bacterium]